MDFLTATGDKLSLYAQLRFLHYSLSKQVSDSRWILVTVRFILALGVG